MRLSVFENHIGLSKTYNIPIHSSSLVCDSRPKFFNVKYLVLIEGEKSKYSEKSKYLS